MGMFDFVHYADNCSECGEPLSGFQSKDGVCSMITLLVSDVNNFYTSCCKCNKWHEYDVKRDSRETTVILREKE